MALSISIINTPMVGIVFGKNGIHFIPPVQFQKHVGKDKVVYSFVTRLHIFFFCCFFFLLLLQSGSYKNNTGLLTPNQIINFFLLKKLVGKTAAETDFSEWSTSN